MVLRNNSPASYLNIFEFDLKHADKELVVLRFDGASRERLEFICKNRSGMGSGRDYDVVIGPVADDKVYSVVIRFENGEYKLEEALKRLKVEQLSDQILFHTENALRYLRFNWWEELK